MVLWKTWWSLWGWDSVNIHRMLRTSFVPVNMINIENSSTCVSLQYSIFSTGYTFSTEFCTKNHWSVCIDLDVYFFFFFLQLTSVWCWLILRWFFWQPVLLMINSDFTLMTFSSQAGPDWSRLGQVQKGFAGPLWCQRGWKDPEEWASTVSRA